MTTTPSARTAGGTYRPNLYFGIRARSGSSPLFGLAWGGPFEDVNHFNSFRHDAEERDHVSKSDGNEPAEHSMQICVAAHALALLCCRYGWLQHDGDGFAVQEMLDREKRLNLTTTFINVRPLH